MPWSVHTSRVVLERGRALLWSGRSLSDTRPMVEGVTGSATITPETAVKKKLIWLLVGTVLVACGGNRELPGRLEITQPSKVSASPDVLSSPTTGNRLSGTVIEWTPSGVRSVSGGTVFFWRPDRPVSLVSVNSEGEYVIQDVEIGTVVNMVWAAGPGSDKFHQPCPTYATIGATDAHRDIEVARLGSGDFRYESPILSGMVFETTAGGRRPLTHARVLYAAGPRGYDAYTETDNEGRYSFCRVPSGTGRVGAGDCNDAAFFVSADVKNDTVVDVDLTDFYASCPGVVSR